jgi:hypothetical protein
MSESASVGMMRVSEKPATARSARKSRIVKIFERVGNKGGYAAVFHEENTSDAAMRESTELADKSKPGA